MAQKPNQLYSQYVDILNSYDGLIAQAQENLLAIKPENDTARQRAIAVVERLKEFRRSWEDRIRKIEPGER